MFHNIWSLPLICLRVLWIICDTVQSVQMIVKLIASCLMSMQANANIIISLLSFYFQTTNTISVRHPKGEVVQLSLCIDIQCLMRSVS